MRQGDDNRAPQRPRTSPATRRFGDIGADRTPVTIATRNPMNINGYRGSRPVLRYEIGGDRRADREEDAVGEGRKHPVRRAALRSSVRAPRPYSPAMKSAISPRSSGLRSIARSAPSRTGAPEGAPSA